MKKFPGIDYSQRPVSYFQTPDGVGTILRNIRGSACWRLIAQRWLDWTLEQLSGALLVDTMPCDALERFAEIDPALAVGEQLPDLYDREVEIARVEVHVAMPEAISIRAWSRAPHRPRREQTSLRRGL